MGLLFKEGFSYPANEAEISKEFGGILKVEKHKKGTVFVFRTSDGYFYLTGLTVDSLIKFLKENS